MAFPAFLGVGLLALFSRGTPWQGEWAWTIDWVTGETILTGPILAGAVAFDIQRVSRSTWQGMLRGLRRGGRLPLQVAVAMWGWATVAHLATMALAVGLTAVTKPSGPLPLEIVLIGPLALASFAAIGIAIGTFLPRMVSAPIALIVAFALTYLGSSGSIPPVFRFGATTSSLVGLNYNPYTLLLTIGFLASFALLVGLIAVARFSIFGVKWIAGPVVAGMVALVSLGTLHLHPEQRFVISEPPPPYICAGKVPKVCLAEGTSRQLRPLAEEMEKQGNVLTELGIALPQRYVQELPGRRPAANDGVIFFSVDKINAPGPSKSDVADYLATPAACPAYYDATVVPESALAARAIVADIVRVKVGAEPLNGFSPEQEKWLSSPAAAQWLASTFVALRDCNLDAIKTPF